MRRALLIVAFAVALASQSVAEAATIPRLIAEVGPEATISLTTENGQRVTQLDPGTYTISVSDRSNEHNFHLEGPGVDEFTDVGFIGTRTWTVTFREGRYTYYCDPHAPDMMGRFTVGNPPAETPPPPPPPSPSPPVAPKPIELAANVGPGFTIALLRAARRVVTLRAGAYVIRVRDRSTAHNFHLIGPGVNKKTAVAFNGTTTWRVTLRRGTYRYICDPHATQMRGTFRVG